MAAEFSGSMKGRAATAPIPPTYGGVGEVIVGNMVSTSPVTLFVGRSGGGGSCTRGAGLHASEQHPLQRYCGPFSRLPLVTAPVRCHGELIQSNKNHDFSGVSFFTGTRLCRRTPSESGSRNDRAYGEPLLRSFAAQIRGQIRRSAATAEGREERAA